MNYAVQGTNIIIHNQNSFVNTFFKKYFYLLAILYFLSYNNNVKLSKYVVFQYWGGEVLNKTMSSTFKYIIAIVCSFIILCSIIGLIILVIGANNADKTGTFNIFGKSYHLMQSNDMEPVINNNEMIVVKHIPSTSFIEGDLVAFYYEQFNGEYLLVRRLEKIDGMDYFLLNEKNEEIIISAGDTRFLGIVTSKSAFLGKMLVSLQSKDGKMIFIWWSLGILFFIAGITMMIHVILKNKYEEPEEAEIKPIKEEVNKKFDFSDIDFDFDE